MSKKINVESLIGQEIEHLEEKINEFQLYLRLNNLTVNENGTRYDELEIDAQDKLHKEIIIQIKMQDALFNWLPLLEKLKEGDQGKKFETRGDIPTNGLYNRRKNQEE